MTQQPTNSGPRVVRREAWADLPADYAGFRFRLWVNAPNSLWNDINSGDDERALPALQKVVLEHNGWQDFDGQVYAQPSDPAFWEQVPTELVAVMLVACQTEMLKLPNSIAPKKRR